MVCQIAAFEVLFVVYCGDRFQFSIGSVFLYKLPDREASNREITQSGLNCYERWKCTLNKLLSVYECLACEHACTEVNCIAVTWS